MSIAEAMRLTRLSRSSFFRWRRANRVPFTCGKQLHVDDLNAAIAKERGVTLSNPTRR